MASDYTSKADGPDHCHDCSHYSWPHLCNQPQVIADAKRGVAGLKMQKNGKAVVNPGGWCKFFKRS